MTARYDYQPPSKSEADVLTEQIYANQALFTGEDALFCHTCRVKKFKDGSCACHLPDPNATEFWGEKACFPIKNTETKFSKSVVGRFGPNQKYVLSQKCRRF